MCQIDHFSVPKRCGKGHKFSAKTGDCECELIEVSSSFIWPYECIVFYLNSILGDSPSKNCAIITDVRTGMDARSESFIQSNTIPEDFKYKVI